MNDKVIRLMAQNDTVRIIAVTTTNILNHIKNIHKLNELTSIAFGRLITVSAMISATNKTDNNTIMIKFETEGSIGNMTSITRGDGTLKGFISNPDAFCETLKLNDLIGEGFLIITKDLGLKNPYTSKVPLYKSDVCNDLAYYYTASEQTPTAIIVGIDFDDNFNIKNSVGLMVQMMPDADEFLSDIISYRFEDLGNINDQLKSGKTVYDILNFMFDDMGLRVIEEKEISYKCDCSYDKVERALISLGVEELSNIIKDNKEESILCDYCKTEYKFTTSDLEKILHKISKKC